MLPVGAKVNWKIDSVTKEFPLSELPVPSIIDVANEESDPAEESPS